MFCSLSPQSSIIGSQEFHATGDLFGLQYLVDQHQTANDLSNRTLLGGTDDACVACIRRRQSQEIIILSKDHPTFVLRPPLLLCVRGSQRSRFGNSQDIHASSAHTHDHCL